MVDAHTGDVDRTSRAVDRISAGVFALLAGALSATWLLNWWSEGVAARPALVVTVLLVAVVVVRAAMGAAGPADQVVLTAALVSSMTAGMLLHRTSSGVGADATPAFAIFTVTMIFPASVLRRRVWAIAVPAGLFLLGRVVFGLGFVVGLDEVIAVVTSCVMLAVLVDAFRSAARMADTARAEGQASREESTREAAGRRALEERRRLLHDEVLSVLSMVERAGHLDEDQRIRAWCRDQVGPLRGQRELRPKADFARVLAADYAEELEVAVTAEVDPDFDPTDVPDEVVAALVSAVGEALRNVGRHSGVRRAALRLGGDAERGVQVTVADDGRGFEPGTAEGFGLQHSIRARVAEIGGEVEISSAPGEGTLVRLGWRADAQTRHRIPRLRRVVTTHELLSRNGNLGALLSAMAVAAVIGPLWMALRYPAPDGRAPYGHALAVAMAGLFVLVPRWCAAGMVPLARHALLQTALIGSLALGLLIAGPGALRGFESWIVGMVTFLMMFMAFSAPLLRTLLFAAVTSGAVAIAAAIDPTLDVTEVLSPVTQPVLFVGLAALAVFGIGTMLAGLRRDEAAVAHRLAELAFQEAQAQVFDEHFALLAVPLAEFLDEVGAGRRPLHDAATRALARAFALEARDDLYLPGLVGAASRERLRDLRRRGGALAIRAAETTSVTGERVDDLVVGVLSCVRDWSRHDRSVTVSLGGPRAPHDRVVVAGPLDDEEARRVADWASQRGAEVRRTPAATVVTLPRPRTGVARRSPETGTPRGGVQTI